MAKTRRRLVSAKGNDREILAIGVLPENLNGRTNRRKVIIEDQAPPQKQLARIRGKPNQQRASFGQFTDCPVALTGQGRPSLFRMTQIDLVGRKNFGRSDYILFINPVRPSQPQQSRSASGSPQPPSYAPSSNIAASALTGAPIPRQPCRKDSDPGGRPHQARVYETRSSRVVDDGSTPLQDQTQEQRQKASLSATATIGGAITAGQGGGFDLKGDEVGHEGRGLSDDDDDNAHRAVWVNHKIQYPMVSSQPDISLVNIQGDIVDTCPYNCPRFSTTHSSQGCKHRYLKSHGRAIGPYGRQGVKALNPGEGLQAAQMARVKAVVVALDNIFLPNMYYNSFKWKLSTQCKVI
ncbi:hypothetical protein BDN72DRAFT_864701 [Pluteus cervinus]|uniref:Uncharacterized protein n=1 Tax=Pluteus cervinus TaxID=181527 RepID=A0ACD3A3N9_9AGAR|nr:hypothetical protein BDN72DRAFT_864701 [Pluteus cervinus]